MACLAEIKTEYESYSGDGAPMEEIAVAKPHGPCLAHHHALHQLQVAQLLDIIHCGLQRRDSQSGQRYDIMDKYADQYQIQKIIDTYIPVSYQGLCNKESAEHIQQIQHQILEEPIVKISVNQGKYYGNEYTRQDSGDNFDARPRNFVFQKPKQSYNAYNKPRPYSTRNKGEADIINKKKNYCEKHLLLNYHAIGFFSPNSIAA